MSDLIALLDATLRLFSNENGTDKKKSSKLPITGIKPGGYPVDIFLDGLSQNEKESYQCGICFLIAKNACHCLNKHQFCRSCVTVWAGSGDSENHNQCPVCRAKGYYMPSGKVADSLNSKTVRCVLRSCVWTGQLRDMQYHRHILSKKIADEGQLRIHRKNSESSDDCSESDSDRDSRTPTPSSSPVLPRILPNSGTTSPASSLCSSQQDREETVTNTSSSHTTFLQMLRSASSASSSVDVAPRRNSQTTTPVARTTPTTASNTVVPTSAEVLRCYTPRSQSPTPTIRIPPRVSPAVTTTPNNTTAVTAGLPVRHAVLPNIQSTGPENNATSLAPGQPVADHCCNTDRRTGPKEYERLRARMRETSVRIEQMKRTRRELARFQELHRLQHLAEVRELGRQLNDVTFQIRHILNQMSATDDQNTRPTTATTTTNNNNNHHHHYQQQ